MSVESRLFIAQSTVLEWMESSRTYRFAIVKLRNNVVCWPGYSSSIFRDRQIQSHMRSNYSINKNKYLCTLKKINNKFVSILKDFSSVYADIRTGITFFEWTHFLAYPKNIMLSKLFYGNLKLGPSRTVTVSIIFLFIIVQDRHVRFDRSRCRKFPARNVKDNLRLYEEFGNSMRTKHQV